MKKLIAIGILAALVGACTKGYVPDTEPEVEQPVEVAFSAKANFSVTYTRAGEQTYNGVIGAVNVLDKWEFAPSEVTFDGLVGNAATAQSVQTNPESVVMPTGSYTFVSCAVSGGGSVAIDDAQVTLTGGEQTADNDVVWCKTPATVTKMASGEPYAVSFDYAHTFSAVRFELNAEGKNPDQLMAETSLQGVSNLKLATNGVMDIKSGVITPAQDVLGADGDIDWKTNYLVLPGQSQAGQLAITYRGTEYKGTLPAKNFVAGQRTVVSITLNTATLTFAATVKEWEVVEEKVTLE